MIEIVVIVALLVFILAQEWQNRIERKKLIDAYLAKNLTELKQAEKIEKELPVKPEVDLPPAWIPVEEASDEEFDKAMRFELGKESLLDKAKAKLRKHG